MVIFFLARFYPNMILRTAPVTREVAVSMPQTLSSIGSKTEDVSAAVPATNGKIEWKGDVHVESVKHSLTASIKHPFFGSGYKYAQNILLEHNHYLFNLVTAGIFAAVAFGLFMVFLFISLARLKRFMGTKDFDIAYFCVFLACFVFIFLKLINQSGHLYYHWVILALISAWIQNIKRSAV